MRSILTTLEENLSWKFNNHVMNQTKRQKANDNFHIRMSSNSMLEEIIEVKIMLLQLKTIIELVRGICNQPSLHIVDNV